MRIMATSEVQIAAFQADGYLHLPRYLDESALDAIKQTLNRVVDRINTFRSEEVYYEDKTDPTSLKQIQHLENKDDFFQQLVSTGKVYELAQELLQEEPIECKEETFASEPDRLGLAGRSALPTFGRHGRHGKQRRSGS